MTSPALDYAKVTGRVAVLVGDTPSDPDTEPDIVYADTGTITFTPQISALQVAGPPAVLVGPQKITADIDSSGHVSYQGVQEVWLLDLGSEKVNPTFDRNKGAYLVEFAGLQANGTAFKLPSFYCNPDSTLTTNDIALMMQFTTGASGQLMVVGPPGPGLAPGGTTGQVAAKASSSDYDTAWIDPPTGVTDWADLTGKPAVIAAGADAATARAVIGAGTSSFDGTYAALTGKPTIPATAADVGAVPTTRTVAGHALSADVTLAKADVGLGSVDNTADSAKAVLSASKLATARTINGVSFDGTANITVADSTKVATSAVGAANGVAGLDANAHTSYAALPVGSVIHLSSPDGGTTWKDLAGTTIAARPTSRTDVRVAFETSGSTMPAWAITGDLLLKIGT